MRHEMDRLTANDLLMVLPEDFGWPEDIAALLVIEGETLFAADDKLRLPTLRRYIDSRLHLASRFRQFLLRPRLGLGRPLWADAQAFDITHHVGSLELPAPEVNRRIDVPTVDGAGGRRHARRRPARVADVSTRDRRSDPR